MFQYRFFRRWCRWCWWFRRSQLEFYVSSRFINGNTFLFHFQHEHVLVSFGHTIRMDFLGIGTIKDGVNSERPALIIRVWTSPTLANLRNISVCYTIFLSILRFYIFILVTLFYICTSYFFKFFILVQKIGLKFVHNYTSTLNIIANSILLPITYSK